MSIFNINVYCVQCPPSSAAKRSLLGASAKKRTVVDAQKYQLMDLAVQPSALGPILFAESKR